MPFEKGNRAAAGANHAKRLTIRQAFIAELNEASDDGATRLRRVVRNVITAAEGGDLAAAKLIFERVDGRAPVETIRPEPSAHRGGNGNARRRIADKLHSIAGRRENEQGDE